MLLKKNENNPGIEKQMLWPQEVLGRASLQEGPQSPHGGEAGGQGGGGEHSDELGSDLVPSHCSHFTSTYSHN